jgi:hypothetical protein
MSNTGAWIQQNRELLENSFIAHFVKLPQIFLCFGWIHKLIRNYSEAALNLPLEIQHLFLLQNA